MKVKHLLLAAVLFVSATVYADIAEQKTLFNTAITKLGQNQLQEASNLFENLYKQDTTNMNVAYLLGSTYARMGTNLPVAVSLLEKASKSYSPDYVARNFEERRVSEYVYYYLLMAYSLNGDKDKTIGALNTFYKIYSYENEYYLIEGQRLHREAQTRVTSNSTDLMVYEK